jgi:hydrogenase expression/formation protein HypD
VTPDFYIDYAYNLSLRKDLILATYGDMIRVPGSNPSITLEKSKAMGAEVKIVYSSMEALEIAKENPEKKIIFLGIGFETTAPATAIAIIEAQKNRVNNFYTLSVHKRVEPVIRFLMEDKELDIQGFLIPGHVAAIVGKVGFDFLEEYKCSGVVTGFSLEEITYALLSLIKIIESKNSKLMNCYDKLVQNQGNVTANNFINRVFDKKDDYWRGMGKIANSGYKISKEFSDFDIERLYPIDYEDKVEKTDCQCGQVLKGKIKPKQCPLYKNICNPDNPVGPCMVSSEGSCAAYFRYDGGNF